MDAKTKFKLDGINSKYINVEPNVELHYLEKGKGDTIIFIPGLTFSGEIFKNQIEYFSKQYHVIAIDPRGQGLSTKTVNGNDYITHGKDLAKLIEKLNLDDVVLVGWSTGNLEVWSYISQFGRDKVKAVATIDMSPLPLSPDPKCWVEGSIEELTEVVSKVLISPEGTRDFFKEYATEIMIQHNMEENELEYILDISGQTPYWICSMLFANAICSNFYEIAKEIGKSEMPSLMFIAEHWSDIAKPFVEKNFPGTDTYVMGGHLMFYEYPEKWNSVLEEFINKI